MNLRIESWGLVVLGFTVATLNSGALATPTLTQARQQLASAAIPFVPNSGQWDPQAAFAAHTFAGTLFVTTTGTLVLSLPGKTLSDQGDGPASAARPGRSRVHRASIERTPGWTLTETFVDAAHRSIAARPRGVQPAAARVSYFIGNDEREHRRGLDSYARLDLGEVFPGVNVQLRATGSNVEKIFTVAPHRDPAQIRLQVDGVTQLELSGNGQLLAHTGNGPLAFTAPIAFQEDEEGRREIVNARYMVDPESRSYGFVVAGYDTTRPLVIDPLLQSTYLGAAGAEEAFALAIHPVSGEVYVAGSTSSLATTFPGVSGGAQGGFGGGFGDAFVSRFSADLTTLRRSSYLGAGSGDAATALAIHPVSGDVYIAGSTGSLTTTFPGVSGGAQGSSGGGADAFISRFSADLTMLLRSTYLGAAGDDEASALAIHPISGEIYVAGVTSSPASTFPGVSGGAQGSFGGGVNDAFVSRFSADLTTRLRSTYLGAAGDESASALAIHPTTGEVYVAGSTSSPATSFPGVSGGAQGTYGGGATDAFVSRFSADLTTRLRSTYLGAAGDDQANALAIHPATGEIYVAGMTSSPTTTFPGASGGAQGSLGGGRDAFVSRFSIDLTTLLRSTYLGAAGDDIAYALAIHPVSGEVYVAGSTTSAGSTFPGVSGGAQANFGGPADAYVSRFSADLTALLRSSYLGAVDDEEAHALAIHPVSGEIYVAGLTNSLTPAFPGVGGSPQGTLGGGYDAFVSRFSLDLQAGDVVPNAFVLAPQLGVPLNVVRTTAPVQISGLGALANVSVNGALGSGFCISTSNGCACDATPGGTFTAAPAAIANNQYLCVRHVSAPAPNSLRESVVIVGGGTAKFQTYTGTNLSACALDIDGNGAIDALTDGLMILRAMFGLTGTSVTNQAVGAGATRGTWAQIQPYLNGNCGTNFAP